MVSHHFLFLALFILCSSLYIVGHENFVPHTILKGEGRLNCSCCLALGGEASDSWGQQYFFKAVLLSNAQNNKWDPKNTVTYYTCMFNLAFGSLQAQLSNPTITDHQRLVICYQHKFYDPCYISRLLQGV